jgi:hypothetical protein
MAKQLKRFFSNPCIGNRAVLYVSAIGNLVLLVIGP